MQAAASHLADVCVRFEGHGGGTDVACSAAALFKASPVLREALGAEFVRSNKRTADGLIILPVKNERITPAAMRDALEYAHDEAAPSRWPWQSGAPLDRVVAACEACRYLDVDARALVGDHLCSTTDEQVSTYEHLSRAVEVLDIACVRPEVLYDTFAALAEVTSREMFRRGDVEGEVDMVGILRPLVFVHRAWQFNRDNESLKALQTWTAIEDGDSPDIILRKARPAAFIKYVDKCSRGGWLGVPLGDEEVAELDVACELALLRGVPPLVIAWTLDLNGRLSRPMYEKIVSSNMTTMTPLDFPVLAEITDVLELDPSHAVIADMTMSLRRACAHMPSSGSGVRGLDAFLVQVSDRGWSATGGAETRVRMEHAVGVNDPDRIRVTASVMALPCDVYTFALGGEGCRMMECSEMTEGSLLVPVPGEAGHVYVLVVPHEWRAVWCP